MTPDDYLKRSDEEFDAKAKQTSFLVSQPLPKSPDEYAQSFSMAKSLGLPTVVVDANYKSFAQRVTEKRNETILKASPKLTEWVGKDDNYRIAADKIEELSWWEQLPHQVAEMAKGPPAGVVSSVGTGMEGVGQLLTPRDPKDSLPLALSISDAATKSPEEISALRKEIFKQGVINPTLAQSILSDVLDGSMTPDEAMQALEPAFEPALKAASEWLQTSGEALQEASKKIIPASPGMEESFGREVGEGLGSLLAILGIGWMTGGAGAAGFGGAMGAGEAAARARKAGQDEDTQTIAAFYGIFPGMTDAIPIERLLNNPATKAGFAAFLRSVGKQVALEGGQELTQEVLQNTIEKFLYNPKTGIFDDALRSFQVGGFIGGLVEAGRIGLNAALPGRARRAQHSAERAGETVQKLEEISQQAQTSTMRERSPEKFREFLESAMDGQPVENIFVPAERFTEYFQSLGVDPWEIVDALDGVTRDDLDVALAGGSDLRIPTATYAAHIAGSEHDAFIVQNARFDPDEMTAEMARRFKENENDYLQEMFDLAEEIRLGNEHLRTFEEEIYQEMRSRLRQAGRSHEVATTEAMLYPAFYRVMAERSGETVEDFMKRYPLPDIRGERPEGMQFKDVDALSRTLAEARNRRASGLDRRGPSLLEFIDHHGGINDVGGDVRSMVDNGGVIKRGRGKKTLRIVRGGMAAVRDMFGVGGDGGKRYGVDDVALAAIEAGYLADDPVAVEYQNALREGREVPNIGNALLEAIGRELRGETQYSSHAHVDETAVQTDEFFDGIEEELSRLGVGLDDDDATIREAIRKDQEGEGRKYGQSEDTGQRGLSVQRNGNMALRLVKIGGARGLSMQDATEAFKGFKSKTVSMASGETVAFNRANKAIHSWMRGGLNRSDLIPHLPEIVENAVSYADSPDANQPGHKYINAVARVSLDGREISVRLILRDVGDGKLRQYQFEGFDVAATPASNLRPEDLGKLGRGAATTKTVSDVVADFKAERRLFQSVEDRGGRGAQITQADPNAPVNVLELSGLTERSAKEAHEALKKEAGVYRTASGQDVRITTKATSKALSRNANAIKRSLVGEFGNILENSVVYGGSGEFSYAAAHIRLDGRDVAVRLVIKTIHDGTSRLYQLEGIDLTEGWSPRQDLNLHRSTYEVEALPIELQGEDNQQTIYPSEDQGSRGLPATAPLTVGDLVAGFNSLPAGTFPLFQGPRGSIQFPLGGVADGQSMINLYQSANLSTFLHESGHYFLAVMQDMAAQGEASVAADLDAVRAWWRSNADGVAKDAMRAVEGTTVATEDVIAYLDNGTTGDVNMDMAIDIGLHEQWARAFEAYLMEGKSPNVELRSAFEKFREWLKEVYRKLAGLNVQPSDEIRSVMDRMLATDEEIAKAKELSGAVGPVFASAEAMGLSQEEYDRFLKLRERAEDESKAKVIAEIMAPLRRERDKKYKEERAKVREEMEREVNAYRFFRAIEWMGNRRWLGMGQPEQMPDIRLSKDILVERYGSGILDTLPRGRQTVYAVEGGIDPDDAAGWFGFDSGDELVRAMETAPKRIDAIEAETDKRMRELHGDVLRDGEIEAIALDAVHSERHTEWVAAELKAITNVAGVDVALTAQEARHTARQTIARMRVRDAMAANRFLAAERAAGEEAARLGAMLAREGVWMNNARRRVATKARAALREDGTVDAVSGQIEQANRSTGNYNETVGRLIEAKRRQLLNHALYMEARSVTEEVQKAERFVAGLSKKSKRDKIAGAGRRDNVQIDYLAAIDEVLDRYDFRKMSGRAEERRGSLNAFVNAMKAAGRENELAIPESVLADAARRPYKTLPVEEMRGVIDSLKNLEHMALRWNKLIDEQRERELEAVTAEIAEAFEKNMPKRPPGRVGSRAEAFRAGARQTLNSVLNAGTILREIDGFADFGAAYRNIKAPIDEAMNRLIVRKEKAATDLDALYSVYTKDERRRMAVREHIPALGYSLSKWERIAIALNTGNEGNYQRMTDDRVRGSLTEAQVGAVLASLDHRDADFVQSVWDYLETFRDDLAARERRATGVEPKWVEARAVEVGGKMLKGGYYPLRYDPRLSELARDDDDNQIWKEMRAGRFGKAQTRNGHLKERAKSSGRAVELDMSVMHRHVNQVIYDLELSEAVSNSWRILQDGRVRSSFTDAGRSADFDALEAWLLDTGQGELKQGDIISRGARTLKSNFTAAKLAFNLSTVMVQVTGLPQSMVVVGKKNMAVGIAQTVANPISKSNEIAAKSAFMKSRQTTFNKDIYDMFNDPKMGPVASRWNEARNNLAGKLGLWLMTKVQFYVVDVPTWLAGYRQGMAKFGNDEAKAIAHADAVVKRAQASGLFLDRSAVERGTLSKNTRQNDVVRLFTALGSYMFAKFNVAYERTMKANRTIRDEGMSARSLQEALSWTLDMAFLFTVEAVLYAAIKGKLPDDDDDEDDGWLKFLAKETGLAVMSTIPFVRDVGSTLQGFEGGGAYGAITKEIAAPFVQLGQGEADKALVKSIIGATGLASGVPSSQVNRFVDAAMRQADGEDVSVLEYLLGRMGK